jgi:hypothetical protein
MAGGDYNNELQRLFDATRDTRIISGPFSIEVTVQPRSFLPILGLLLVTVAVFPMLVQKPETRLDPHQEAGEQELRMRRELAKKLNQQRQETLKRDTDKLLKLTTELKQHVDNSNENLLSVDVVKRAEEIEKLARSVKEKMKGY